MLKKVISDPVTNTSGANGQKEDSCTVLITVCEIPACRECLFLHHPRYIALHKQRMITVPNLLRLHLSLFDS
jgi:hypothetical protein